MKTVEWLRGLFRESEPYFECRECGLTVPGGTEDCPNCPEGRIVEYDIR